MILTVLADDVGDPFEIVDAGLMGIVLVPADVDDGTDRADWAVITICPN